MKRILIMILPLIILAGCDKDFLDINRDPNNPTVAPNKLLLPGIQVELARWMSVGDGVGTIATVYSHQGTPANTGMTMVFWVIHIITSKTG
jgi:hypothetical protein